MMNTQNDWQLELSRLVALAERFSSEGQMNLNKLVEAAIYAQVRRAGWLFRPQVTVATMQSEMDASLHFLKQNNTAPELIAALEVGQQAIAEKRQGDMLFTDAPNVFVCRTCGHVALGSPPDHCPDCGAWPGRFRKFVAFFNQDNIEPINPVDVLAMLARNAEDLSRLVEGLSEEAITKAPPNSDWSIREHIAHFADTQDMLDTRIELMLKHDNPDLTAIAVYEFATDAERHPSSAREILATFREKRAKCVARMESLPLKDLWRSGRHPEFGQLTILRQAAYLAFHEQTHLPEVEALRMQIA
jgi:rubrerythrin